MRKLIICVFVMMMTIIPASHALDYLTNLYSLQDEVYSHSPRELDSLHIRASIKGKIISIENVTGNHYEMTIEVDDPKAAMPLGADGPLVVGHFRLHLSSLDEAPFSVGGEALIVGELNTAYSTWTVPYLMIEEINGYDSDEY